MQAMCNGTQAGYFVPLWAVGWAVAASPRALQRLGSVLFEDSAPLVYTMRYRPLPKRQRVGRHGHRPKPFRGWPQCIVATHMAWIWHKFR